MPAYAIARVAEADDQGVGPARAALLAPAAPAQRQRLIAASASAAAATVAPTAGVATAAGVTAAASRRLGCTSYSPESCDSGPARPAPGPAGRGSIVLAAGLLARA